MIAARDNSPLHREIAHLRDRVAQLEEELRYEREKVSDAPMFPLEWRLTRSHEAILARLLKAPDGFCTNDSLRMVLRSEGEASTNIVSVHVSHMRSRLRPRGVEIETVWGRGYRLPPRSREILKKAVGHD